MVWIDVYVRIDYVVRAPESKQETAVTYCAGQKDLHDLDLLQFFDGGTVREPINLQGITT